MDASARQPTIPTPTPIPTLAPLERPSEPPTAVLVAFGCWNAPVEEAATEFGDAVFREVNVAVGVAVVKLELELFEVILK